MTDNMYLQDPNEYIRNLSQVRASIIKNVSQKLNPSSSHITNEIQRQIKQNYDRYKKNILVNQRIQLTKQHQESQNQKRKQTLQQMIQNKIRMSKNARERKKEQLVQNKRTQRLMKEAINQGKRQQIRKQNLQKSIQIIQKIQEKTGNHNQVPIKLRILEENIKNSRVKQKQQKVSLNIMKRSISESSLPKINRTNSGSMITERAYLSKKSQLSTEQMVKNLKQTASLKRSKSLLQVKKSHNNEEEILLKMIQLNQNNTYNNYLLKNSLSYTASHHSRLNQVKNAIQDYLKNPNPLK